MEKFLRVPIMSVELVSCFRISGPPDECGRIFHHDRGRLSGEKPGIAGDKHSQFQQLHPGVECAVTSRVAGCHVGNTR